MKTKVAINGFGRIGRNVAKAIMENYGNTMEVVAINDLTEAKMLAHLFQYDSFYGIYDKEISTIGDGSILVDGKEIQVYSEKDPANLPWSDLGIDVVMECTGIFRSKEDANGHILAGAKLVIISSPPKDDTPTFVMGVNEEKYDPSMNVISNASCTTNCLGPVVKVLHQAYGIEHGMMLTVHSYTASQRLLDAPHKDYRRARAAVENIIPTTTGAAKAFGKVMPELDGKLSGYAIRVPTPNVSLIDLTCTTEKEIHDPQDVNVLLTEHAKGDLKGILGVCDLPLVSVDYRKCANSATIDLPSTMLNGNMLKVVAWYDNEWGYSARMADLAHYCVKKGI